MEDLFKALQMFQQGASQYATTSAINDATRQFNELNQAQIDESQKRQQLQNLGNQLALKLSSTGATGNQIQSAFQAIAPQSYGSAEQMQLEGALLGGTAQGQQLQKTAEGVIQKRDRSKLDLLKQEYNIKNALEDKQFQREMFLTSMKLSKQDKDLKPEEVAFQTNVSMANNLIDKLSSTVEEFGTYENAVVGDKRAAAIMDQVPYQLAIQYAKIVDPASVAREGEVAAAQKYLINLDALSNKTKALSALNEMKTVINQYKSTRAQAQGQEQSSNIQVRILKNGRKIKVMQNPDGSYSEVP